MQQAARRAKLVAQRTKAYEAVHPETKHGGARRGSSGQIGHLKADQFAPDTAAKTGKPERSVATPHARKALGPELDRVAGTSLDKGAELGAHAGAAPAERAAIIRI
jgi:ParB family chromosome partitioning protein